MSDKDDELLSLAIILVLYNSYSDVETLLAGQKFRGARLHFIVVDNTPHALIDHFATARIAANPNVSILVATPENLGYAGAARFALDELPELSDFDYIAISNTDLSYDAGEIQNVLSETVDQHVGVGMIAPQLVSSDGVPKAQLHYVTKPKRSHYARLVKVFSFYPVAIAYRLASDWKRDIGISKGQMETPRRIFAPHGAFVIFTNSYFKKTLGFSHPAFLFCEEIFFGLECERAALACIFEPKLKYVHQHHGTMGSIPSRRVIRYLRDAHKAVLPLLD